MLSTGFDRKGQMSHPRMNMPVKKDSWWVTGLKFMDKVIAK